jgi:hypothetical protein
MVSSALDILSGLAYLAVCLLIAMYGARKRCPPEESTPENGESLPLSPPLFLSCLVSLLFFLFIPCGVLPSLLPVSCGALLAIGGLIVASGFLALSEGWKAAYRRAWAPLSLGVSLAVIARYGEHRGVPGDLFTLDAYVAMPIVGAAEGMGKAGVCILAAASLFALWISFEEKPPAEGQALPTALAAELWALAAAAFWVCLFFPFSFASSGGVESSELAGSVLDALVFWGKVLGLRWFLGQRRKFRSTWVHGAILLVFLEIGAWLLLGSVAE